MAPMITRRTASSPRSAARSVACGCAVLGLVSAGIPAKTSAAMTPSFDCARADGTVEELICSDADLSELDRQLADIYTAAVAKSRPPDTRTLKAMQRGWIKGRNDCWKSEDVRRCVAESYRDRIVELQATYALVPGKGPVVYRCDDGSEVIVTFFQTDPPTARAERGEQQAILTIARSGSGARYTGRNIQFWDKVGEARIEWGVESKPITCKAEER